jgi:hypothetical protein
MKDLTGIEYIQILKLLNQAWHFSTGKCNWENCQFCLALCIETCRHFALIVIYPLHHRYKCCSHQYDHQSQLELRSYRTERIVIISIGTDRNILLLVVNWLLCFKGHELRYFGLIFEMRQLKMRELKSRSNGMRWIDEDVMEGKWLMFEKLVKYIIGVRWGLLMNSRVKRTAFTKYLACCEYKKDTIITQFLTRECICTSEIRSNGNEGCITLDDCFQHSEAANKTTEYFLGYSIYWSCP